MHWIYAALVGYLLGSIPFGLILTRAFGAVLSMESPERFQLSYVGRVLLAKKSGEEPMYRLTRAD